MEIINPPIIKLRTNRGLTKFFFLSLITFGIYGIVCMSNISSEINFIARRDGKHTMHYCLMYFIFSWLTLGIYPFVWYHKLSNRIGGELARRNIPYQFSSGSFWGWCILGSLIFVGPFIYVHQLMKAMNYLAADYNVKG